MSATPLAQLLLDALGDGAPIADGAALEREVLAFVETGERAWPGLGLSREGFVAHVASHVARESGGTLALADLSAADLYLAYGCITQSSAAVAAFDAILREAFQATSARLRLDDARKDDVLQRVRQRLLVGDGHAAPKILAYSGRGALGAWTRVAALRTAYNFMAERPQKDLARDTTDDLATAAAEGDPELEVLARRYGDALNAALSEALAAMGARERTLLRYSYIEALSIDHVGAIYGVHRATAARWIAAAREALFEATRERFRDRVALSDSEFTSMVRSLRSYLDMSLEALLVPSP